MIEWASRHVRIGVQIAPAHADYSAISRAVVQAEDMGADLVFNWDHFFPLGADPTGKHFECWTMLAAWAEATSRIEFGPLVTSIGYRNPDLLADMARTVDHISEGRLVLGLGAGFREREYVEYGYDPGTPATRLADLAAALPRIEARFTKLNPPPVRRIPVLIGGGGERKTLRLVAAHADIWHTFADGDDLTRKSQILADHCAAIGRDPAEIERSAFVGGDPNEVGPDYLARGVTLFTIITRGPDFDMAELGSWLAWRDRQNMR